MSRLQWVTPANLGVVKENWYFEKQLEAVNANGADINYTLVTDDNLYGISLKSNGLLYGTPVLDEVTSAEQDYYRKITVRAVDTNGDIVDRTFDLMVSGALPPTITNTQVDLGTYTDGDYFEYQFNYEDQNTYDNITWKLVSGDLPNGVTLSSTGLLQGFLMQNLIAEDGDISSLLGWSQSPWDIYTFDFNLNQQNRIFTFTLELNDGIYAERRTFTMTVLAKDLSNDPVHAPILTTPSRTLPQIKSDLARQQTYFAFRFTAIDFDGDEVLFKISSYDNQGYEEQSFGSNFSGTDYPLPFSLGLNEESGWLTGFITAQLLNSEHQFYVYPVKKRDPTIEGHRVKFKLVIAGLLEDQIEWDTDSYLGSIKPGDLSYFSVKSHNKSGKEIVYRLDSSIKSRTPQGISFLPSGLLYGRATFNYFTFDKKTTTFDNNTTTFDKNYTFSVIAENVDGSAQSTKTFTLETKDPLNYGPYENLYIQSFPPVERRVYFENIFNNETIFPPEALYRPEDPWYGKTENFKFLFMSGISPAGTSEYITALETNHNIKTIEYGDIKTAVALDDFGNIIYEVVYFEVIDTLEGKSPVTGLPLGTPDVIDLSDRENFYNLNGRDIAELTPNGIANMESVITQELGIAEYDSLPLWMESPQPDPDYPGQYLPPLGFVRAVVVAYANPGMGKLIAYRLKNAGIDLKGVPFTFDRYRLDNYLTHTYDLIENKFYASFETTFDRTSSVAQRLTITGNTVDYATDVEFKEIHGQTVNDIIASGALGNITTITTGEKLVFTNTNKIIGTSYTGYQDYILNQDVNEKVSIFAINVIPTINVVYLTLFQSANSGDIIYVNDRAGYMQLESYVTFGTELRWVDLQQPLSSLVPDSSVNDGNNTWVLEKAHVTTTFDKGATSFSTNRDRSVPPEIYDKYLKFPKNGVFE